MAVMATDSAQHIHWRSQAAEALAELGDPRGAPALAALAADTTLDGPRRRQMAKALAAIGDPRGPDALATMATDTGQAVLGVGEPPKP